MSNAQHVQAHQARVAVKRRYPSTILVAPFALGIFFPYLLFIPLGTDTQPTALIFSSLICFLYLRGDSPPKPLLLLGIPALAAVGALLISNLDFNSLRSLANYVSFFTIAVATYLTAGHALISGTWVLDVVNLLWCGVGLIQRFYDPLFLAEFLSNFRTTPTRGVVSLAAEPSFYGITCLVFLLLYYLQHRERSLGAIIAVLQILFLAESPTAALILALGCSVYFLVNCSPRVLALGIAVILVVSFVWQTTLLDDRRLVMLTNWAAEDPTALLVRDHSVSARFYHIAYSLQGALENGLLPHGYSAWARYLDDHLASNTNRYLGYYMETPDRIMSAIGASFFELGIFATAIPFALFKGTQTFFGSVTSRRALVPLFTVSLVMLNSVPLGFPPYAFLVGYCFAHRSFQFEGLPDRDQRSRDLISVAR